MADPRLSRAEFLLHLARQAKGFVSAYRQGEPEQKLALREIGTAPVMRLVKGKPVYAWRSGDAIQVRIGRCPHDELPVYYREGPDGPAFLCPSCGFLTAAELAAVPFRQDGEELHLMLP